MSENNKRYVYFVSYVIEGAINGTIPSFGYCEYILTGPIEYIQDLNGVKIQIVECNKYAKSTKDYIQITNFQLLRTEDI